MPAEMLTKDEQRVSRTLPPRAPMSNNSWPGDWDPWILIVGGIWALAVLGLFAVRQGFERPTEAR